MLQGTTVTEFILQKISLISVPQRLCALDFTYCKLLDSQHFQVFVEEN